MRRLGVVLMMAMMLGLQAAEPPHGLAGCRIPVVAGSEQAPVIDGKLVASEWRCALTLTGLVSNAGDLAQRQATVRYLSDGNALYVGAYVPAAPPGTVPEVVKGPRYAGKNYMNFIRNDRFEMNVSPPDRGAPGGICAARAVADQPRFRRLLMGKLLWL